MTAGNSSPRHDKPKCGARKKQGEGNCRRPAGWGTDHAGTGQCKLHGGCMPNNRTAAMIEQARQAVITFGLPRDIPAIDALMEEVRWTAGHVAWLREQVQAINPSDLVWGMREQAEKNASEFAGTDTTYAAMPNIWLELYYRERKHLVDVTKAVIAAGIEERRVKLEESKGQLVAEIIKRIAARLDLSDAQSAILPMIASEELRRAATALLN